MNPTNRTGVFRHLARVVSLIALCVFVPSLSSAAESADAKRGNPVKVSIEVDGRTFDVKEINYTGEAPALRFDAPRVVIPIDRAEHRNGRTLISFLPGRFVPGNVERASVESASGRWIVHAPNKPFTSGAFEIAASLG